MDEDCERWRTSSINNLVAIFDFALKKESLISKYKMSVTEERQKVVFLFMVHETGILRTQNKKKELKCILV